VILFILGKAKPRSSRFRFQFTLSNHNWCAPTSFSKVWGHFKNSHFL
jgi:hypothetical protein